MRFMKRIASFVVAIVMAAAGAIVLAQSPSGQTTPPAARERDKDPQSGQDNGFRFRAGVDLVNVTVTVTDATGRFVSGLTRDDFVVVQRRKATSHHAFQRRTCAGQSWRCARHERQHGW